VNQLERCIDILKPNDLFDSSDFDLPKINPNEKAANIIETEKIATEKESESDSDEDDDFEEVPCTSSKEQEEMEMRYLGFLDDKGSSNARDYELEFAVDKFKIDEENKIILEIMRDLQKELNSFLIKIKDWIKVKMSQLAFFNKSVIRTLICLHLQNFNSVKRGQDSLKEAVELKNMIQSVIKKYEDLHLPNLEIKEDTTSKKGSTVKVAESQPGTSQSKSYDKSNEELSESEIQRKRKRAEMLKIAPVINLEEVVFCLPVTQQVETDHRFYGRSEGNQINVKFLYPFKIN